MIKKVVIIVRYSGLGYLINEGFRNVFKNKKSTTISIVTMICAMFLFGIFFSIGENINSVLKQVQMKQGMEVFIYDFATDEQLDEMESKIKALDGVNTVSFKTKEKALESFKEQLKNYQRALEGIEGENNILPASFVVTLTDLEKNDEVQAEIIEIGKQMLSDEAVDEEIAAEIGEENMEEPSIVKNITTSNHTIEILIKIVNGVRITIGIIFIILLVIAVTIISNTIKLTVHARRKEISIMKYVGATNSFIRWPFIVEGIIIGIVAAVITLLIVGVTYDLVIQKIEQSTVLQSMGVSLLQFVELAKLIAIVYAALGIGIGMIGSSISMRKYLEV